MWNLIVDGMQAYNQVGLFAAHCSASPSAAC
jgi:hypothetical protein